jgi:hypothetical protein
MTDRYHPDAHDDADLPDETPEVLALDRMIAEAARDYHRPPVSVPRDAMWEAIMAARTSKHASDAPIAAAPAVVSLDAARARREAAAPRRAPAPHFTRTSWSLAAAASLLLAAGVGMGRWWEGRAHVGSTPTATVAMTPDEAPRATAVETGPVTPDVEQPRTLAAAPESTSDTAEPSERSSAERARVVPPRTTRPTAPLRREEGGLAYDVATVRHLTSVEALLVAYRADPLDSLADARVATWARSLLQDTRLLLDSPAASSPMRRRLFEDLELVLVQMARLAPADSAFAPANVRRDREERALIDGTMRDARVLPRLRNAIPAGTGT